MTLESKLKEIKERAEKATIAPWDNRCLNGLDNMARPRHIWTEYGFICELKSPLDSSVQDAKFIAHARQDVPMLLEIIDHLIDQRNTLVFNSAWHDPELIDLLNTELLEKHYGK